MDCEVCETNAEEWGADGCSCWWCPSCKATNPAEGSACRVCGGRCPRFAGLVRALEDFEASAIALVREWEAVQDVKRPEVDTLAGYPPHWQDFASEVAFIGRFVQTSVDMLDGLG